VLDGRIQQKRCRLGERVAYDLVIFIYNMCIWQRVKSDLLVSITSTQITVLHAPLPSQDSGKRKKTEIRIQAPLELFPKGLEFQIALEK